MSRWRRIPAKYLYAIRDERVQDRTRPPLLSVSIYRGVVPRSDLTDKVARADDLSNYKLCEPGEIVINRMSAYQGALGITRERGIVSPEYIVLRTNPDVEPRFLTYLFKSAWFVGQMSARVRGIGSTEQGNVRTPRINPEDLGGIEINIPPLRDQRALADFLDAETARIDALITRKRRLIELLDERLRAEQDLAFDSDYGWPLKRLLCGPMAYGVLVPEFVAPEFGVPMLRITNLNARGGVVMDDVAWIDGELSGQYRRTLVQAGDVVLSVVGSMGRAAVIDELAAGANLNRPLARLRRRPDLPARLLWHWTQSTWFNDLARLATGRGTAQPTLNLGDLANFRVGLPVNPAEWAAILHRLERACEAIDGARVSTLRQIDLLIEHRQALITAAVTGALAVPGVAA